jgi:hypothetical protein
METLLVHANTAHTTENRFMKTGSQYPATCFKYSVSSHWQYREFRTAYNNLYVKTF